MLRLQKSSFPARRKQATHKATRCCLSTGGGRGREDRAHRPLPLQNRPGVSLQTQLHTGPRECGRRSVPVRTVSQAGTRRATLKGRKPARAGRPRRQASGGHVHRQATGSWLPRRRARTRSPGERRGPGQKPAQTWPGHVHTGQRAAVPRLPTSQGQAGTKPEGVRMPGWARRLSLSPTAVRATRRGHTGPTSGSGRGWAPGGGGGGPCNVKRPPVQSLPG